MTPSDNSSVRETLVGPCTAETETKKSRFIAHASPAHSPADAMAFIARIRDPDATHNCWAYRIGTAYRFSDDGEPAGTAGRPILSAIEHQRVDHAVVVVTRFFGGIKLGAGGLARAYGGSAAACLHRAARCTLEDTILAVAAVPFGLISRAYGLMAQWGLSGRGERFGDHGADITMSGARSAIEGFAGDLLNSSSGAARVRILTEEKP